MKIGDLRHRIELQKPKNTADNMGGFTVTWGTMTTIYAAVWPVSAKELIQAKENKMTITHRIRIRYRDDIKSSWRIKFGVRYFDIESIINPDERNRTLELLCKETA
jgi:SPP1 family predicted phage head-tail adaptor